MYKIMTNGDYIRSLDDRLLAKFFSDQCACCQNEDCDGFDTCKACWIDWFEKEKEYPKR